VATSVGLVAAEQPQSCDGSAAQGHCMNLTDDQIAWLQRNKAMSGGGSAFGQSPAPGAASQPQAATPQIMDEAWKAPPRGPVAPAPLAAGTGDPSTPSAAPPASGTRSPEEEAEARVTTTYGAQFTPARQPKPGEKPDPTAPKAWKKDEVDSVDRAFKAIPPADKGVLQNISLSRVTSLPGGGDTLAEFQDAADYRSGTVTRTILVADGTFSTKRAQILSNDEPTRRIVHEVGHAVASKARDDAELADVSAVHAIVDAKAEEDKAKAAHDKFKEDHPDPADEMLKLADKPDSTAKRKRMSQLQLARIQYDKDEAPYADAQLAASNKVTAAQAAQKQTEQAVNDTKVSKQIVAAGQVRLDSSAAQVDGEASRVASDISKLSPGQLQDSKDYRTTSSSVTGLLQSYSAAIKADKVGPSDNQKSPDDWDSDVKFVFSGRDDNRKALESHARDNPALKILAPLDRAQDSWLKEAQTQARLPRRTPKVQEFVDLVSNAPAIDPGTISDYAATSWPHKPEEFFAECYSLWLINRSRLPERILKWFDKPSYR
jgi:hypothetical protein